MNNKSTPAGIPCHANQFPCTNCCWQCWAMRHHGILCQPHALHASTWQSQTQTAIWPTIAFCRLLSTQQIKSPLTLCSKLFSSFPQGTCLLPVSSLYLFLTWSLPITLRTIPTKRDDEDAHSAWRAHKGKQECHPYCCSAPRGVHPGPPLAMHFQHYM